MRIYFDTKRRYGAPKIHQVLLSKGWHVSLKRVQRRMAALGIHSIVINQKWCTDITYIHTQKDGWTYLASVMDFYSKKIIGWSYGTSMTTDLAIKAVENACLNVDNLSGIILHSDLGSQYTSTLFESYLAKMKIHHSFS